MLRELGQARADHSFEVAFRRYLAPDLLILDDFGPRSLAQQQSEDVYTLIIERRRRSSFIVTSNRGVSEWVGLFADSILANSALDRLADGAHQLLIDGPSYHATPAPCSAQEAHARRDLTEVGFTAATSPGITPAFDNVLVGRVQEVTLRAPCSAGISLVSYLGCSLLPLVRADNSLIRHIDRHNEM